MRSKGPITRVVTIMLLGLATFLPAMSTMPESPLPRDTAATISALETRVAGLEQEATLIALQTRVAELEATVAAGTSRTPPPTATLTPTVATAVVSPTPTPTTAVTSPTPTLASPQQPPATIAATFTATATVPATPTPALQATSTPTEAATEASIAIPEETADVASEGVCGGPFDLAPLFYTADLAGVERRGDIVGNEPEAGVFYVVYLELENTYPIAQPLPLTGATGVWELLLVDETRIALDLEQTEQFSAAINRADVGAVDPGAFSFLTLVFNIAETDEVETLVNEGLDTTNDEFSIPICPEAEDSPIPVPVEDADAIGTEDGTDED